MSSVDYLKPVTLTVHLMTGQWSHVVPVLVGDWQNHGVASSVDKLIVSAERDYLFSLPGASYWLPRIASRIKLSDRDRPSVRYQTPCCRGGHVLRDLSQQCHLPSEVQRTLYLHVLY